MKPLKIAIVGIGRMGKGIALAFAYAGYPVVLIDSEDRLQGDFVELNNQATDELVAELQFLHSIDVIPAEQISSVSQSIEIIEKNRAPDILQQADFVFEAVLEEPEIKQQVYSWLNQFINDSAIVSSTTSTISANDLAEFVQGKHRFINAHWLNPAHLMPLVEVSPGDNTTPDVVESMTSMLLGMGKVPVVCRASPGFIVSRIQALALNEAARIVEEGVASAEDVDKAIKAGFGIRYATLGLLEFVDWGGGDILYHATKYLGKNLDAQRFSVPAIVKENMTENRNGLRDGSGFYDWQNQDIEAYRREKMTGFVRLLQHRKLMPELNIVKKPPA